MYENKKLNFLMPKYKIQAILHFDQNMFHKAIKYIYYIPPPTSKVKLLHKNKARKDAKNPFFLLFCLSPSLPPSQTKH